MPEPDTLTGKLRAGKPIHVGSVTILPIERLSMHKERGTTHAWFSASKQPCALVVRDAAGIRSVGIDAAAVSLEQLREEIPGLDSLLAMM